jgi:hypothetical protein
MGANALHGQGKTNTAPAFAARIAKFEAQADPDGVLSPEERRRRAGYLMKADMQRLALKSSRVRGARKVKRLRAEADALEQRVKEAGAE